MVNKPARLPLKRRRSRGRPSSQHSEDVRAALLTAARDLFARYGYRAVSSRQIAAAAGANVAMIRYYFGGKPGLYKEILESLTAPARARVEAMATHREHPDIAAVIDTASRIWAANPWMAGIVVREVLTPEGSLRPIFIRDIIGRLMPLVEQVVQDQIAAGKLRADLDARLVVLSIVSLSVFPFLAFPLTSKVFGVRHDEEFLTRLIQHNTQLLARGLMATPKENT